MIDKTGYKTKKKSDEVFIICHPPLNWGILSS